MFVWVQLTVAIISFSKPFFFSIKVCDGLVFRVRACRSEAKSALQQIHARR